MWAGWQRGSYFCKLNEKRYIQLCIDVRKALPNLLNFRVGCEIMSNHMPLVVIIVIQTQENT
jgi:hypothetical protein